MHEIVERVAKAIFDHLRDESGQHVGPFEDGFVTLDGFFDTKAIARVAIGAFLKGVESSLRDGHGTPEK